MRQFLFTIITLGSIAWVACESTTHTEAEKQEAINALDNYVDSVRNTGNIYHDSTWDAVDARFDHLRDHADKMLTNADTTMANSIDKLEEEFRSIKTDVAQHQAEFEMKADSAMIKLERWFDKTAGKTKKAANNTADDIEKAANESADWLEKNFDKLGNDMQKRYRKIKQDIKD